MRRFTFFLALAFGLVMGSISTAGAQEFFKGKTIRFVVGYSAGGSFDLYTRTIARHFSKHVPGDPTTIVENMTGAGGIIAANHLYNRAAPDGLTIGAWAAPLVLQNVRVTKQRNSTAENSAISAYPVPMTRSACSMRKAALRT